MRRALGTVVLGSLIIGGCSRGGVPGGTVPRQTGTPTTAPSPAAEEDRAGPVRFERSNLGIRLDIPQGWARRDSKDFELLLHHAAKGGDDAGAPELSLDVPDLPPHIPNMIPIGSVRNGYLDDLRKLVGTIKTTDLTPPPIPASAERMVRSGWSDRDGKKWQETALLLVHADRVYIVRGRSTVDDEAATRDAFDQIVRSLEWIKKGSSKGSPKAPAAPSKGT